MQTETREILENLVKSFVDTPDEVSVDLKEDDMGMLLTLKAAPSDMGKVIGRSGSMANSLRTIVSAIAGREGAKVSLRIHDPKRDNPELKVYDQGAS